MVLRLVGISLCQMRLPHCESALPFLELSSPQGGSVNMWTSGDRERPGWVYPSWSIPASTPFPTLSEWGLGGKPSRALFQRQQGKVTPIYCPPRIDSTLVAVADGGIGFSVFSFVLSGQRTNLFAGTETAYIQTPTCHCRKVEPHLDGQRHMICTNTQKGCLGQKRDLLVAVLVLG